MLLLGIDIGTSSVKISVVDAQSQKCLASTHYPESEAAILSPEPGWAEQSPNMWWEYTQQAITKLNATKKYNPKDIGAIGIAYQMHGLVIVDKDQKVLRDSIIWCDSRAVEIGDKAFKAIGKSVALSSLLNSPGNFTASKLAWVKENEPFLYDETYKLMLPGDFIAMKFTGNITTSVSSLSEGIFWDFQKDELSEPLFKYFGFSKSMIPDIKPVFSEHGTVSYGVAEQLGLKAGIPVTYKAGDQPNNALSLNVFEPGEVAATAGTSGVIYGVTDQVSYDPQSRVNTFAHVNYASDKKRLGVLLCINGTGIMNRWIKSVAGQHLTYEEMNAEAAKAKPGSRGLYVMPFGNGAERMLENKLIGAHIHTIDLNTHGPHELFRAAQEGIAFSFRYGLDIMRDNGMSPKVIRASHANMFLSEVFTEAFVNVTGVPVELYEGDGSVGAAVGAGLGAGVYANQKDAFKNMKRLRVVEPSKSIDYEPHYEKWLGILKTHLG